MIEPFFIYYLSLGSNLGDRKQNIITAMQMLCEYNIEIVKVAPLYSTMPLLPANADESYYKIYKNTAIKIKTNVKPLKLLKIIKDIEMKLYRDEKHAFWSPRTIDIDILYCEDCKNRQVNIFKKQLIIPHKEMLKRAFVLDPLMHLNSIMNVKKKIKTNKICDVCCKNDQHQPVVMGIINITDNSFSGDGVFDIDLIKEKIETLIKNDVGIIDIGAEATNKNADEKTWQEEVSRLQPVFKFVKQIKNLKDKNNINDNVFTKFSIDTYHYETAKMAIENGFEIINDVNGFKDDRFWALMQEHPNVDAVIMHSITPHANSNATIDANDVINILNTWIKTIILKAKKYNIPQDRIILDYGIGFGKTSLQSLKILQNLQKIKHYQCRVLCGHSKKSFFSLIGARAPSDRKFLTLGSSVSLMNKGVDIIRVHDVIETQGTIYGSLFIK